jgi:Uma2 family endonuclease
MSASLKPLTVDEFLACERAQPLRHEFDGIQPVAMTGDSVPHVRVITRLTVALANRVRLPCEAFASQLKVLTGGRVRYPDVIVACGAATEVGDTITPTAVFEVVSPSTALTDRRVKAAEYASVSSIQVYVILETERPEITVLRWSGGWGTETIAGLDAEVALPEINVTIPLSEVYAR